MVGGTWEMISFIDFQLVSLFFSSVAYCVCCGIWCLNFWSFLIFAMWIGFSPVGILCIWVFIFLTSKSSICSSVAKNLLTYLVYCCFLFWSLYPCAIILFYPLLSFLYFLNQINKNLIKTQFIWLFMGKENS